MCFSEGEQKGKQYCTLLGSDKAGKGINSDREVYTLNKVIRKCNVWTETWKEVREQASYEVVWVKSMNRTQGQNSEAMSPFDIFEEQPKGSVAGVE